ncbi:MAG: succinate dehydrogenase cytochrome b subunit [Bdellovibrionota bacterium]|nr:MAG: succinate dehydrogenase cytochrome b subunit [Bdellovibrionota bacterium]
MGLVRNFYRTTVGKKVVMAVTGLILVLFVIGHMGGNLKFFAGIDAATGTHKLDHYAAFLRTMGSELFGHAGVLWMVRVGLLVAVLLHVVSAVQLSRLSMAARPRSYAVQSFRSATPASRSMRYGGMFLFVFIILHILHFTTGTIHYQGFEHGRVFANLMSGFQPWYVPMLYVIAMAALALHLYHGVWSMFQTMGVTSPAWNNGARCIAKIVAVILFVGFSSVPLAAHFGLVEGDNTPTAMAAIVER